MSLSSSTSMLSYPSDAPRTAVRPAPVFYKIKTHRLTFDELWRDKDSNRVLASLLKVLHISTAYSFDDACVQTLAPFEREMQAVPGVIRQRLNGAMQQLTILGFHSPIWHIIEGDARQPKIYFATLIHESGAVWARIDYRVWKVRGQEVSSLCCEYATERRDGSFIWTLSAKHDINTPPSFVILRDEGASPTRLLPRHRTAVRKVASDRFRAVDTADDLRASIERHHATIRDFHLKRGVFVPLKKPKGSR